MGTSIAMHLANRLDPIEDPLVLLERAPRLAAGSSGRSGAILRQQYADLQVARMARNSLADYSSFMVRTGRDIGFRMTGVLTLAGPRAPEWMERVRANVEALRQSVVKIIQNLFGALAIFRCPGYGYNIATRSRHNIKPGLYQGQMLIMFAKQG